MVDVLRREGVDLTAGQTTGSNMLRNVESEVGGGTAASLMERQGEQFTSAALRRAGIEADRASPEVVDQAFNRIGAQFDDLASRTSVPLDKRLQDDMLSAVVDYQDTAGAVAPVVERIMNRTAELAGRNNGVLEGEAYKSLRTEIGDLSQRADATTKMALGDLREALDDAVERSMSPSFVENWRTTRNQYRNMLALERAATGAGENAAAGIISPSQLRNATVVAHGRRNYARGQGDFAELARAGEGVMKPLPNSGTAARTAARNIGTGSLATIMGILGHGAAGAPGAVAGVVGGSAIPYGVGRMLLSEPARKWLGNQAAADVRMDPRELIAALLAARNQGGLPAPAN